MNIIEILDEIEALAVRADNLKLHGLAEDIRATKDHFGDYNLAVLKEAHMIEEQMHSLIAAVRGLQ